jgi:hypothetical protein
MKTLSPGVIRFYQKSVIAMVTIASLQMVHKMNSFKINNFFEANKTGDVPLVSLLSSVFLVGFYMAFFNISMTFIIFMVLAIVVAIVRPSGTFGFDPSKLPGANMLAALQDPNALMKSFAGNMLPPEMKGALSALQSGQGMTGLMNQAGQGMMTGLMNQAGQGMTGLMNQAGQGMTGLMNQAGQFGMSGMMNQIGQAGYPMNMGATMGMQPASPSLQNGQQQLCTTVTLSPKEEKQNTPLAEEKVGRLPKIPSQKGGKNTEEENNTDDTKKNNEENSTNEIEENSTNEIEENTAEKDKKNEKKKEKNTKDKKDDCGDTPDDEIFNEFYCEVTDVHPFLKDVKGYKTSMKTLFKSSAKVMRDVGLKGLSEKNLQILAMMYKFSKTAFGKLYDHLKLPVDEKNSFITNQIAHLADRLPPVPVPQEYENTGENCGDDGSEPDILHQIENLFTFFLNGLYFKWLAFSLMFSIANGVLFAIYAWLSRQVYAINDAKHVISLLQYYTNSYIICCLIILYAI